MAVLDPRQKTQQEALATQRANTAAKQAAEEAEKAKTEAAEAKKAAEKSGTPAAEEESQPYYIYKEPAETSTYPVSFAKNLMGGNVDVISKLKEIKFEQYDGSLKNAIAYIVPWKRDGVSTKTQAQTGALSSLPAGANLSEIGFDLTGDESFSVDAPFDYDEIIQDTSGLDQVFSEQSGATYPAWNADVGEWGTTGFTSDIDYSQAFTDTKGSTPGATGAAEAEQKQKSLGSDIPVGVRQGILTGAQFAVGAAFPSNSQTGQYIETGLNLLGSATQTPTGPIYIGNENGTLNQVISGASSLATAFGMNVPKGLTTTVKPDTQPKTPKDSGLAGTSAAAVADGAWQFLFNPASLVLSAGPDFAETQTWGVLDDKNGGQPLHFTKLKNPTLRFSEVLLNGYVFGRQVEDLEQGLFKLFNEAGGSDNGVQTGPQVLEFIWGKKSFGPCVIKNIQVTEKMWDDGLLVNATVNFELVKVPEWTVNDGQVSVYAPGSIGTITAPTAGPVGTGKSGPDSKEKTEPPETQEENFGTFQQCKNIQSDIDAAQQVSNKIKSNSYYQGSGFIYEGSILYPGSGNYRPTFPDNLNTYNSALSKYKSNSFYSPYMTGYLGEKCLNPTYNFKTAGYDSDYRVLGGESNATKDQKIEIDKKYNAQLSSCADQLAGVRGPLEEAYRNLKCNNYHTNPGNSTERI